MAFRAPGTSEEHQLAQDDQGLRHVEVVGDRLPEAAVERGRLRVRRRFRPVRGCGCGPSGHPLAEGGEPGVRALEGRPAEVHLAAVPAPEREQPVGEGVDARPRPGRSPGGCSWRTWPSSGRPSAGTRRAPTWRRPDGRWRPRTGRSRPRGGGTCCRCRRCGRRSARRGTSSTWPSTRCASRGSPRPRGRPTSWAWWGPACFHSAKSAGWRLFGSTARAPADGPPGAASRVLPESLP